MNPLTEYLFQKLISSTSWDDFDMYEDALSVFDIWILLRVFSEPISKLDNIDIARECDLVREVERPDIDIPQHRMIVSMFKEREPRATVTINTWGDFV